MDNLKWDSETHQWKKSYWTGFKSLWVDGLGATPLAVGLICVLVFGTLIGSLIWLIQMRIAELVSAQCVHTPVNWASNTFYVTDDDWACPYKGMKK